MSCDKQICQTMNHLRCKFRGALLGALFGDALGALFEGDFWEKSVPSHIFDEFRSDRLLARKSSGEVFRYTDDTAMTRCICRSLLAKGEFNAEDMAGQFVEEFYREPFRGYGAGVVTVFKKIHENHHEGDVTKPARDQFDGTGSYGNGAAMRVSPLALFHYNNLEKLIQDSRGTSLITHSHKDGMNGAILQAVAVSEALNTSEGTLDTSQFIDKLIKLAVKLEDEPPPENGTFEESQRTYVRQVNHVKKLLSCQPTVDQVVQTLGHGVEAIEAVPAAIFSFLYKSQTTVKDVIFYAISLGGDTDTIASMAGAIAGGYWGDQQIPKEWFDVTEAVDETIKFAEGIFDLRVK